MERGTEEGRERDISVGKVENNGVEFIFYHEKNTTHEVHRVGFKEAYLDSFDFEIMLIALNWFAENPQCLSLRLVQQSYNSKGLIVRSNPL